MPDVGEFVSNVRLRQPTSMLVDHAGRLSLIAVTGRVSAVRLAAVLDRLAWAPRAGSRPSRGLSAVHEETVVPASLEDTFAFFADAANLERLTPAWLNFRVRTPMPVTMAEGLEIEYRVVLHGVPIPWRSRIDVWEP